MNPIDLLFGKIALKNRFVDQDTLQECARALKSDGASSLGQLLFDRGLVNEKQFKAIAAYIEKKTGESLDLEVGAAAVALAPEPPPPPPPAPAPSPRPRERSRPSSGRRGAALASGAIPPLAELLRSAKESGASDLHFSPEAQPAVRRYGELRPLKELPVLDPETSRERLFEILTDEQRERLETDYDLDTCLDLPSGRYRASILKQRRGYAGVFRVINDHVPSIDELGLPPIVEKFTSYHQGIVLVTGAAGSGKSSTLAALIELINKTRKDHVITLEDPIEYVFDCKKANVSQRQIEMHTKSWENALRASLREDPDVIMVGEMRDLETMRLAVTAAETGHLVLATLHTTNATRTIDRLLDVFPPKEQAQIRAMVSESLRGVVSQQLVPRADGKGRVCAVEILFNTPAVGHLIRERQTFKLYSILQTGKRLGMQLMDDSLKALVKQGLITEDEARRRAVNPRAFSAGGDDAGGGDDDGGDDGGRRKRGRGWRSR